MLEIRVHPMIKFTLLLMQMLIIIFVDDLTKILVFASLITAVAFIFKVRLKPILLALTYGMFLSIFTFSFNYIFSSSLMYATTAAINVFGRFYIIICASIFYKQYTTNKETAYVISKIASKFGAKQNQVYTIVLIILNQIYNLRNLIFDLYRYNKIESENLARKQKIIKIVKLLPVFINNALRQNDSFTLALLNKNYHADKKIKVYLNYNISNLLTISLIILVVCEILITIV